MVSVPFFGGTYAAAAGVYFVGALYNSSAQAPAPTIASYTELINLQMAGLDFTNSAKISSTINVQTALTTPLAMSTLTGAVGVPWFGLY
jgi:hypothetical protein